MQREYNLDSLRGIFLVVMTLNHWPGPVPRFTSQPLGMVSAAEGFVFVSGLTAGIVYSQMAASQGAARVKTRVFSRAGEIYRTHFSLLFLIFSLGLLAKMCQLLPVCWVTMIPFLETGPMQGIFLGGVLVFQPMYFNVLPLYLLLILLVPPVLNAFVCRKFFVVFGISFALWALAQLGLTEAAYQGLTRDLEFDVGLFFDPFAWQLLFVAGLWLGHQRYLGISWLSRNKGLLGFCLLSALILAWYRYQLRDEIYLIDTLFGVDMSNWTSRSRLGPLRLFNFMILLQLFAWLISSFPRLFVWRWSCFLGRYSLQVFSYHIILIYLAWAFNEWAGMDISPGVRYGLSLLGTLSLLIPACYASRFGQRRMHG